VAKKMTKKIAKQLTILRRQATKNENDLYKVFRNMIDASIFELQSFRFSSKKSSRKSSQKTTIYVLDASHLSPSIASCIDSIISFISSSLLPSLSPSSSPISKSKRQRKASLRKIAKRTIEESSKHEEMATPIKLRVNRTRQVIKSPRR